MQEKTTENPITRTSIYLLVAAIVSILALVSPAAAADRLVPFNGSLHAQEAISAGSTPATFVADGSGGGIATLIGRFTLTWRFTVTIADGTGTGPVRFTAANGDEIFTTAAGISWPADTPGVFHIQEIQTITGGTGRFAGARGTFVVERLTDLNTGLTSGSFHGTITSPVSAN